MAISPVLAVFQRWRKDIDFCSGIDKELGASCPIHNEKQRLDFGTLPLITFQPAFRQSARVSAFDHAILEAVVVPADGAF